MVFFSPTLLRGLTFLLVVVLLNDLTTASTTIPPSNTAAAATTTTTVTPKLQQEQQPQQEDEDPQPSPHRSGRPVAIVTGGTRGIGRGIALALADAGYDLLLTYNVNQEAATEFASSLSSSSSSSCCRTACIGGDIALSSTRDAIFECLDTYFENQPLRVMVHNAGQYVGITSAYNSDGLTAEGDKSLAFGDGSLLQSTDPTKEGTSVTNFDTMHYYQRMYGEAFIDLCERSLLRMSSSSSSSDDNNDNDHHGGGSLVGISSPGVNAAYYGPIPSYSMPGAGKCLMEYAMRIYAIQTATRNINCNVIVPGVTRTEAWTKLAQKHGYTNDMEMMEGMVRKNVPMKKALAPRDIGNVVGLFSPQCNTFHMKKPCIVTLRI